jgi:acyl carrier protein phosphodiesterase
MNFLAHIYLSGDNDLIKIGNFMADGIRGKHYEYLPTEVQKGIVLHRAIDTYTDAHPIFRQSTKRLHNRYHHYAGVIVDVFYDHFLAKNWSNYSNEKLEDYVKRFYDSLETHRDILTEKTVHLKPYMIEHNWLVNYQYKNSIARILTQMDHRTKDVSQMQYAIEELEIYYDEFEGEFTTFFADLIAHLRVKDTRL